MKHVLLSLLLAVSGASAEELFKTVDFAKGKGGWQGPGTVIQVDAAGNEVPAGPAATAVLRVKLSKTRWSVLEQRARLGKDQTGASLRIELQTSADFAPLATSKEYAPEDFREGGEYVWSARIFTKAGLLIQLSEGTGWLYRPKALKPSTTWQTVTASFTSLKSKQNETLAICLPPGEGHVDIKSVSFEGK